MSAGVLRRIKRQVVEHFVTLQHSVFVVHGLSWVISA